MKTTALQVTAKRHGVPFAKRRPILFEGKDITTAIHRRWLRLSIRAVQDELAWFKWSGRSSKGRGWPSAA